MTRASILWRAITALNVGIVLALVAFFAGVVAGRSYESYQIQVQRGIEAQEEANRLEQRMEQLLEEWRRRIAPGSTLPGDQIFPQQDDSARTAPLIPDKKEWEKQ